jgi:CHAD domain-containing protein
MSESSDPNQVVEADSHPVDRAELVHEARKAIKRMRALARLLRNQLGEQEFERVNDSLRSAGRRLGGARDAEVRLATLERLRSRHPKVLSSQEIGTLCERLEREREQASAQSYEGAALADIADMRHELARWNLVEQDFEALAPGLQRIYREGRHRYARARRGGGRHEQDIHDWRKRAKALYYALDMLGAKKKQGARRATRLAERLGELLGEEHDMWMLCVYVEEHLDALGGEHVVPEELLKLLERRRRRLRKRALKLGKRLYKRKPGKFTRRMGDALGD